MSTAADALKGVCYALAALYGLVVCWCAVRLVLLQRAAPKWSQQKLSHLLALLICAGASRGPERRCNKTDC